MIRIRIAQTAFWAALAFAVFMAIPPNPPHTALDQFGDKFEHMLAFATLALLAGSAFRAFRSGSSASASPSSAP